MQTGRITVITGPMFSEKSGELIRRCQKLIQFGRKKVVAYKPAEDDRFAQDEIVSRIGYRLPCPFHSPAINPGIRRNDLEPNHRC